LRHKVINFPRKKLKEVEKQKKRFRCHLSTDKSYEIEVTFHKVHRYFVCSNKWNKSHYENVILGSSVELDNGKFEGTDFNLPSNISLHDYSRIFLSGMGKTDSELFIKFISQAQRFGFIKNYDLTAINIEFGVVFYENEMSREAGHMGWYNIMENDDHVTLVGTLFYKYNVLTEILRKFQEPMNSSIVLTLIDKSDIAIKGYPWNKSSQSFFDNKLIFYFQ
jgi:hypothetical protein